MSLQSLMFYLLDKYLGSKLPGKVLIFLGAALYVLDQPLRAELEKHGVFLYPDIPDDLWKHLLGATTAQVALERGWDWIKSKLPESVVKSNNASTQS